MIKLHSKKNHLWILNLKTSINYIRRLINQSRSLFLYLCWGDQCYKTRFSTFIFHFWSIRIKITQLETAITRDSYCKRYEKLDEKAVKLHSLALVPPNGAGWMRRWEVESCLKRKHNEKFWASFPLKSEKADSRHLTLARGSKTV